MRCDLNTVFQRIMETEGPGAMSCQELQPKRRRVDHPCPESCGTVRTIGVNQVKFPGCTWPSQVSFLAFGVAPPAPAKGDNGCPCDYQLARTDVSRTGVIY